VERKWKYYHIITFPGLSLSKKRDTHARCFLWRQNNPEVNYSPIRISGGEYLYGKYPAASPIFTGKERILSFKRGSSGPHYVVSSLWKRLWTCRKTDY